MAATKPDRDQIVSSETIDAMIANGDIIVIFGEYVLRLNSWLANHPGGSLAILHMVGRDATSEITTLHTAATVKTMKAFRIGRKPVGPWTSRTPPIRDSAIPDHREVSSDAPELLVTGPDTDTEKGLVEQIAQDMSLPVTHNSFSAEAEKFPVHQGLQTARCQPQSGSCTRRSSPHGSPSRCRAGEKSDRDAGYFPLSNSTAPSGPQDRPLALSREQYADWALQQGKRFDAEDYPPLEQDVQEAITEKYIKLHERIVEEGLYECRYTEYGKEMIRYSALFGVFIFTLHYKWYITSACALGLFWHQIMFTAHDAGHRAITQIFVVDTLIGMFIADFCCGLSIGWWKSSHNIHHIITNHPEHDPDIQNVPLFATCVSFLKSIRSSYYDFTFVWDAVADFMVPYQKYTYYPIMGIARFNLYLLSWLHVLSSRSSSLGSSKAWWIRPTEITFMACYWFLFGYLLLWRTLPDWTTRVIFVLVSHIITMPLHVQITLSHWGMSTSDLGEKESYAQRQLRTTMDVDCPEWLDYIHGGLQFQAVHHLFPRVPRHNLRKVQGMVREFCHETGIPYAILGFFDGNRKVLSRLDEVSSQVKLMLRCQNHMAETGESGLH